MKKLYLVDRLDKKNLGKIVDDKETEIIVFDYNSHNILQNNNIKHRLVDTFLTENDRVKIFQQSIAFLKWFSEFNDSEISFEGINFLKIIDRNELLEILMTILPTIYILEKILQNNPTSVIATSNIYKLLSKTNQNFNLELLESNIKIENFNFNKISIGYELGLLSLKFSISREKYKKIKKIVEKIILNFFGLNKFEKNKKKIILVEFNPENYANLLHEINKQDFQPILINFRRSAAWSLNSIKNLRNSNSIVISPENILKKNQRKNTSELKKLYLNYADSLKKEFEQIFRYKEIRFGRIMHQIILDSLKNRLDEYITQILVAKQLVESHEISAMLMLNLSGETEKIFSKINTKNSILLQHAFSNYNESISRFDILDDYDLIKDKIAVWGNIVKDYLIQVRNLPENKIIVCGSPKYDNFFVKKQAHRKTKKIVITLRPIIFHMEGIRIELFDIYEKTLLRLMDTINKIENIEMIFKLHPQQIMHNEILKQIIQNHDSSVRVLQNTPIENLLNDCDLLINIAPDNFDASSVILEAMIFERPILNIQLQKSIIEFEFLKDKAVRNVYFDSELIGEIKELLFNEQKINELKNNTKYHFNRYLKNQHKASESLINSIKNLT